MQRFKRVAFRFRVLPREFPGLGTTRKLSTLRIKPSVWTRRRWLQKFVRAVEALWAI